MRAIIAYYRKHQQRKALQRQLDDLLDVPCEVFKAGEYCRIYQQLKELNK